MTVAASLMPMEILSPKSSNGFEVAQPFRSQKTAKGSILFLRHSPSSQLDCRAKIKFFGGLLLNV